MLTIPTALLLLLILPLIILLHFIRKKKKAFVVPSLLIWNRVLAEHRRLFQVRSLLTNINLILQLLAAALLIIALAQPMIAKDITKIKGNIICIIDDSASMKAKQSGTTRFDIAKDEALDLAAQLDNGNEMMIIGTGPRPNIISSFSSEKHLLKSKIKSLKATDQGDNIQETLRFAQSLRKAGDRIFLITDGAFTPITENELTQNLYIKTVADSGENSGITRFQFRKNMNDGYEILLQVQNFSSQDITGEVVVKVDKYEIERKIITLTAGSKESFIFYYQGLLAGSATAELLWKDDLKADNKAYDVFQEDQEIRILYVSPGNPYLESALLAYPRTSIDIPESLDNINPALLESYDIVVYDRITPPRINSGNILLVASLGSNIPAQSSKAVKNQKITWWDNSHPLTRDLNFTDIYIEEAAYLSEYSKDIVPIMKSGNNILSFVYSKKDFRAAYLGFDLTKTDFPLRVSFPLFINKVITYLNTGYLEQPDFQISPGDQFIINLPNSRSSYTITTPGKDKSILEYSPKGSLFLQTEQSGFYQIEGENYRSAFAVNIADKNESDIYPKVFSSQNVTIGNTTADFQKIYTPVWHIFALLALICLIAEWLIWMKKWD